MLRKFPSKYKFKKLHQSFKIKKINKLTKTRTNVVFGDFGVVAVGCYFFNYNQLETARRVIVRCLKRSCKIWFRLTILWSQVKKSKGSRMGKGMGKLSNNWLCFVPSGSSFIEFSLNSEFSKQIFFYMIHNLKQKSSCKLFLAERFKLYT